MARCSKVIELSTLSPWSWCVGKRLGIILTVLSQEWKLAQFSEWYLTTSMQNHMPTSYTLTWAVVVTTWSAHMWDWLLLTQHTNSHKPLNFFLQWGYNYMSLSRESSNSWYADALRSLPCNLDTFLLELHTHCTWSHDHMEGTSYRLPSGIENMAPILELLWRENNIHWVLQFWAIKNKCLAQ